MKGTVTKVLLVEDNDGHAHLIMRALSKAGSAFRVARSSCLSDALQHLARASADVVLADLNLPDSQGTQTLVELRRSCLRAPLVVLTSVDDDTMATDALEQGAQDYLVKDSMTPELLKRTLRYAIHREHILEEKARLVAELETHQRLLQRKNKRLGRLYKMAQRFVDNVSHDFRTPLTVIKEYAALLNDGLAGTVTGEQRRLIDVISDRADDLNRMVDDMLDVSKISSGLMGVYRKSCQAREIVGHVLPALQKKAALKDVSLTIQVPERLPPIYCDDDKIGRVLVNLVVNAIKFCGEPGQVSLCVRHDTSAEEVVFEVTDNGPGIEASALEKIFQRFNRTPGMLQNSRKGFGLGLNIAKELMNLNLGAIHVHSEVGRGSTFAASVPVVAPLNIVRRYLARLRNLKEPPAWVTLLEAAAAAADQPAVLDQTDAFLNCVLNRGDLVLRVERRRWLVLLDRPADGASDFLRHAQRARQKANRNCIGEPLPEIHWNIVNSWRLADDSRFVEEAFQTLLCPGECLPV
jgi:hypothetical protein